MAGPSVGVVEVNVCDHFHKSPSPVGFQQGLTWLVYGYRWVMGEPSIKHQLSDGHVKAI